MADGEFDQRNRRLYQAELWGSIIEFIILYYVAKGVLRNEESLIVRGAISLAPICAFGLILRSIYRGLQRMDELQRRNVLEIFAWFFAVTLFVTVAYSFLDWGLRLPKLSLFSVWVLMAISWTSVGGIYVLTGRGNPFWPWPRTG
ncbi:MAG: hypothetical protein FJX59_20245 [Alphaproteobacteria bacterium]|nr:hypothetical protein [Alphaproteobacteria bacterium]